MPAGYPTTSGKTKKKETERWSISKVLSNNKIAFLQKSVSHLAQGGVHAAKDSDNTGGGAGG